MEASAKPTKVSRQAYYQTIAGCLKWGRNGTWQDPFTRYNTVPIVRVISLKGNLYYYSYWISNSKWSYLENLLERIDKWLANRAKA